MRSLLRKLIPALVAVIAACGDPTAVPRPMPDLPSDVHTMYAENSATIATGSSSSYSKVPEIPTVMPTQGNGAAWNYCFSNLASNGWMITSDQRQRAVWDSAHAPHDTVFRGRLRAKAKYWAGTYSGQPVRCIRRDSVWAERYVGPYMVPISQIEFDQDTGVDFCWGVNPLNAIGAYPDCYYNPAQINVFVKMRFGRNCNLWEFDLWNKGAFTQEYANGGLKTETMKWHVRFYAVSPTGAWGWWQVEDYGAQASPYTNGWRNPGGPPYHSGRFQVCSRYAHDSQYTPGWYDNWWGQRGGWARWLTPTG